MYTTFLEWAVASFKSPMAFLVVALAFLSGCAVMSQQDCLHADWYELGYRDGSTGQSRDRLQQRQQACVEHGITSDKSAYYDGYEAGLDQFCTAASGYQRGREGYRYNNICPPLLEGDFLTGYQRGHEVYQTRQQMDEQDRQLRHQTLRLRRLDEELHYSITQLSRNDLDPARRQQLTNHARLLQRHMQLLHLEHREQQWRRTYTEREYRRLEREYRQLPNTQLWNY